MTNEIKEILDKLKDENNYQVDYNDGSAFKELFTNEINLLLDYITNLQEKLKVSQTNEETYRLEMQDITKILGLDEHITFDEVKEYATNLQEENRQTKILKERYQLEKEVYKSRNEKAIEYNYELQERYCHSALFDDLVASKIYEITEKQLNILQGEDKDE